jgi:TPR repeat protein
LIGLLCALGLVAQLHAGNMPSGGADPTLQAALTDYAQGDWDSAWFRLWSLARQGNAAAQFDLAQLYRFGKGIPADPHLAFTWYEKAATQRHGYAQYNLAVMYEFGQGTQQDLAQARAWYSQAAAQNIAGSRAALERLDRTPVPSHRRASP